MSIKPTKENIDKLEKLLLAGAKVADAAKNIQNTDTLAVLTSNLGKLQKAVAEYDKVLFHTILDKE